jgi:hypothetical protein
VFSVEISVHVLAHLGFPHCQLYLIPSFIDTAVVFSVEISVQVLANLVVLTASSILFFVLVTLLLCSA